MKKVLAILAVVFLAVSAQGAMINIVNPSFETPPTGHTNNVLPDGWLQEGGSYGTEVGPSDGDQCMFVGAGSTLFQTTDHTIAAGDEYVLKFDAKFTWSSDVWPGTYEGGLYYDDGGTRESLATADNSFDAGGWGEGEAYSWIEYTVNFTVGDDSPAIGKNLGFSYTNTTTAGTSIWSGADNVRLELVPEPCSLLLFGLGGLVLARRKRS